MTNDPKRLYAKAKIKSKLLGGSFAIAALLIPAGCGSTRSKPIQNAIAGTRSATAGQSTTTTASGSGSHSESHIAPVERIEVTSPAVHDKTLPTHYTCDGHDAPPPLRWRGIPSNTAELMLFIIKVRAASSKLDFAWAVAHIKPSAHGISHGQPPSGAVIGTNSSGQSSYRLCPPKGSVEPYVVALFALPRKLTAKPGFEPTALRRQAEHAATYQSLYIFQYTRH
jgi:phosphatidylethanolamine-binding protein (PEBP) family uncharacterized protein